MAEQKEAGRRVLIVHHIDADGVSSAAIAARCLERAGVAYAFQEVKSLDELHVTKILARKPEALWFCDLGSTAYMHFPGIPKLVCDHHQLVRDGHEESFAHINPLLDDLSGSDISGAGAAFLAALGTDPANVDQAVLALVGATGDRQDRPFQGANQVILDEAVRLGLVEARRDLAFFGPVTRPLGKFLQWADPEIPGASSPAGLRAILDKAELTGRDVPYASLSRDEQQRLQRVLVDWVANAGRSPENLFRYVVWNLRDVAGPTQELQEFATLLNSTARYDQSAVGLRVAMGDRGEAFEEALDLRHGHRKHLAGAMSALGRRPIEQWPGLQFVHMESDVLDTVVGIVAGMALSTDGRMRQDKPLLAYAWTPDGRTKASCRANRILPARGLDLASALRAAAEFVGGQGGGHAGAAGATFPRDAEQAFLEQVNLQVLNQLDARKEEPK